ncbi:hypothetical protein ABGB18_38700 [Nonomuraea sp. B12E4]
MSPAGEPWVRIRNIRTLRALAAPLAAVSIAIATAAGRQRRLGGGSPAP